MEGARSQLEELFEIAVERDATDIHISAEKPPIIRIDGRLTPLTERPVLTPQDTQALAYSILNEEQKEHFLKHKDIDLSFSYKNKARFRINAYQQLGQVSMAMRLIPTKVRTLQDLNLPEILTNFTKSSQGFFLVVGPSGHGKSTAMAAMINEINHTRYDHIITIEDPIEYVFVEDKCIIDQREVGTDVSGFHRGLRAAFRQDPDIVMIGEMRDPETVSSAVTAAETGHMVFATLHTNTAAQTIDRIIDIFPPHQQGQIRTQLASTLIGILSRRLVPCLKGGMINAIELMIANAAIRSLIREQKIHQIDMVIETSVDEGMISLNRSLASLVKNGIISLDQAEVYTTNVSELRMLLLK